MHPGSGPGLTTRQLGQTGGAETVTLSEAQMPNHTHTLQAAAAPGSSASPADANLARALGAAPYKTSPTSFTALSNSALPAAGGSQAHNNLQPFLAINYIIALTGVYPSRS